MSEIISDEVRTSPLSADRAIGSLAEDRLGLHETFIPRLARVAVEWPEAHGLVVALDGEWGSGKTSALNLLRDYLDRERSGPKGEKYAKCRFVSFHPWLYDDPATLVASFFATLATELGGDSNGSWKVIAGDLKKMGQFLAVATRGVRFFGVSADIEKIFEEVGGFATAGSEFTELMDQGERKLTEARGAVEKALREVGLAGGRLIILLDDIDRLAKDEIIPLLRLLRIVADLPFVTIIVAMDQQRVRELLRTGPEAFDEEYLEKMVQVTVPVPPPDPERFADLLQNQLRGVLGEQVVKFPKRLTPGPYTSGSEPLRVLHDLIRTPRDLARFANALRVLLLADPEPRDLDPVDAALIAAVQVFRPALYERIRENMPFLTWTRDDDWWEDYRDNVQGRSDAVTERRLERLRRLIHGVGDAAADPSAQRLITQLFGSFERDEPRLRNQKEDAAHRRIRSPTHFHRYFGLAGVATPLSRVAVERVARQLRDATDADSTDDAREIVRRAFTGIEPNSLGDLIDDLGVHLLQSRPRSLHVLGHALVELADELPFSHLRSLFQIVFRGMAVPPDQPGSRNDDLETRASEVVTRALENCSSTLSAGVVLTLSEEKCLGPEAAWKVKQQWLRRVSEDIANDGEPFPEQSGSPR